MRRCGPPRAKPASTWSRPEPFAGTLPTLRRGQLGESANRCGDTIGVRDAGEVEAPAHEQELHPDRRAILGIVHDAEFVERLGLDCPVRIVERDVKRVAFGVELYLNDGVTSTTCSDAPRTL